MTFINLDTKSFLFKDVVLDLEAVKETEKMINENAEKAKAEADAKVIADMDKAQASFMDRVRRIKGDSKNDR